MKRIVLLLAILFANISAFAKVYDFESNDLGWNEFVDKEKGEVLIKEGVLSIESKTGEAWLLSASSYLPFAGMLSSTCYLPIDVTKSFEIKIEAFANKIKEGAGFGVIFNYRDASNYERFLLTEDYVYYQRYEKGLQVGIHFDRIKFRKNKEVQISMLLKKAFDTVVLIVDDVQVLEIPYVDYKYRGFGFCAIGKQTVTFDNLETIIK